MRHSITFTLEKQDSKGRCPVRMAVTWSGGRFRLRLDNRISPKDWDAKKQQPKRGYGQRLKTEMTAKTAIVVQYLTRCDLDGQTPRANALRLLFYPDSESDINPTLRSAIDRYIAVAGVEKSWTPATVARVRVVQHLVELWDCQIRLSEFGENKFSSFSQFMFKHGNRNSTVKKNCSVLRWCLNWCEKHDMQTDITWRRFEPKFKEVEQDIIYLNSEELQQIMKADLKGRIYLERVRDVFLFCCFSGLRYSDASKLEKNDVKKSHICVVTKKTSESLTVELNSVTRQILAKYKDTPTALALPIVSNQKMNDYLKELCRLAGIDTPTKRIYFVKSERVEKVVPKWELVTSHCARRTFVVSALTMKVPLEVVMKWTGHSDTKAIKPYVAIVEELKKKEMSKFDNFAHDLPT